MLHRNEPLLKNNYQALSIDESYCVESEGRLLCRRLSQKIEASRKLRKPLQKLLHFEDIPIVAVEETQGCHIGYTRPVTPYHRLWSTEILLNEPLGPGQNTTVEFVTWFDSDTALPSVARPVENCRRQIGTDALQHLKLAVEFYDWKPDHAVQGRWDADMPVNTQPLPSSVKDIDISEHPDDPYLYVARGEFHNLDPDTVVGISWQTST